jgi:hypothetical protein
MISARFAVPTLALLGIALVPTIIHVYLGRLEDDGRRAAAVGTVLAGMTSTPASHSRYWGRNSLGSHDWIARDYMAPDGNLLQLTLVRTWDAKRVYHHPELAVAYGVAYFEHEVVRWPPLGDAPVHVLRTDTRDHVRLAVYCLVYGDEIIGNPYWFQLQLAGESLFRGRRPMTLVFVRDDAPGNAPVTTSRAGRLLVAAVRAFLDSPGAS